MMAADGNRVKYKVDEGGNKGKRPKIFNGTVIGTLGLGAPIQCAGTFGLGKGLIAAPVVTTVSSWRTPINHVASAASIVAAAPIILCNGLIADRVVGNGILANGLIGSELIVNKVVGNGILIKGLIADNELSGKGLIANRVVCKV
ncbi:hypothetical protein CDAR_370121 [Caerostris darwini]|uniref:Uncharacterized protein n=1 Tax=Caerostris darwini TaxID=1538125 RepID=A0AAV4PDQ8_9ARAC|nr:hypothetical protein CDAR_370121 [Caerostris darwini]